MHSQRGKGIFSQFKKYLQEYIEVNQKRRSLPLSSTYYSRLYKVEVLFVLLLYVPSQQLWSLRDGQFT